LTANSPTSRRLPAIHVRGAAGEGALEIAERIAAHTLDAELGFDLLAEKIGERAGAGQLDIAVRVFLHRLGELDRERRAVRVAYSFGHRDDAAPEPVMDRLDLGQEFGFAEDALG